MRLSKVQPTRILGLAAATLLAVGCVDQTTGPDPTAVPLPNFAEVAGEGAQLRDFVVVLREERAPTRRLLSRIRALGGTIEHRHDEIGVLTVSGLDDATSARLGGMVEVEAVARDFDFQWIPPIEQLEFVQMDELPPETDQSGAAFFDAFQWNMRQVKADDAWLVTPQGEGSLLCIMDSGIDPGHIDLAGKVNLDLSKSFFDDEPDILDRNFHGTFVTGIVGSNGIGTASVAPDADLCMIKIAGIEGLAPFGAIIDGFLYAGLIGADAVNISFGGLIPEVFRKDPLIVATQRAVNFAFKRGTLIVASAGNSGIKIDFGSPVFHFPSGLDAVVSVGATAPVAQQNFDALASYTNYGRAGVNILAPGGDFVEGSVIADLILAPCSSIAVPDICGGGATYVFSAGTSFSAPHVTGAAGVIESTIKLDQGASYLRQCLFEGADEIDGRPLSALYGRGRLNVLGSVMLGKCGGVAPPPPDDDNGGPPT